MKQYQNDIKKAAREMDRERGKLEKNEKQLMNEMRKAAKENNAATVRMKAKDIVRSRKYQKKFGKLKSQLQAMGLRMQCMKATASMCKSMENVTRAMGAMNQQMNPAKIRAVMMAFQQLSTEMGIKEELMDQAMEDMEDSEGEMEDDADLLVKQIMQEAHLSMSEGANAGQQQVAAPAAAGTNDLDDMQARLDNLRK